MYILHYDGARIDYIISGYFIQNVLKCPTIVRKNSVIEMMILEGMTTPEMVSEARFYDLNELTDFTGEVQVVAYAVQTDGFDENASSSDIWSTTVQAVGN